MTKYLISFPSAAMVVPDEELQAVSDASHAVVQEAKDAGVWVFGGGIDETIPPVMVDGDGTVTVGTYQQTRHIEGGYAVLELLPGVRLVPAPGHTRGIQVVVVSTGGRPIVVCGDVAVWFGELDEPKTEGQLLVRALDPELVWLAHTHEPWCPPTV